MVHRGIIIGTSDPLNVGRYLVHIPSIMTGGDYSKDGIWCDNGLNNVIRFKDTQGGNVSSMGAYIPLKKGMGVEVEMTTFSHGKIVKVIDNSNTPSPNKNNRDGFTQLLSTVDNTYIYYDEEKKLFHILINNGETNLTFDDKSFHLNVGHTKESDVKGSKGIEQKTGTVIKIIDKGITLHQNESYVRMLNDDIELRTSKTSYIRMNKDVLEMYAPNIIINADKKIHIHSDDEFIISSKNKLIDKSKIRQTENTDYEIKSDKIAQKCKSLTVDSTGVLFNTKGFECKASTNLFVGSVTANGSMSASTIYGISSIFGSVSSPSPTMSVNPSSPSIAMGVKTTIANTTSTTVLSSQAGTLSPNTVNYGTFLARKLLSDNQMPYKDIEFISKSIIEIRNHDNDSNKEVSSQVDGLKKGKLW